MAKIIVLGNIDDELSANARGRDLAVVAHEFNCDRIKLVGEPGHYVIRSAMDVIIGVRWPYFVVLRGNATFEFARVGHVEELGQTFLKETYPRG